MGSDDELLCRDLPLRPFVFNKVRVTGVLGLNVKNL